MPVFKYLHCVDKVDKRRFIKEFLKGGFSLIYVHRGSIQTVKVAKRMIQEFSVATLEYTPPTTSIHSVSGGHEKVEFFDCRGEKYDVYMHHPRYKSRVFKAGLYYAAVVFDKAEMVGYAYLLKKEVDN